MQEFLTFKEMLAIAPQINYAFALAAVVERGLGRENVRRSRYLAFNVTEKCYAFVPCFVEKSHLL